eukprot:jgi/Mesen1/5997/ME000304S05015
MKRELFEEIREAVSYGRGTQQKEILQAWPGLHFETVVAITSQESSKYIRQNHHKFRAPHQITQYAEGDDILEISAAYSVPPSILARFLLENLVKIPKHSLGAIIKDPSRLPEGPYKYSFLKQHTIDPDAVESDRAETAVSVEVPQERLRKDLYRCTENDTVSSPSVEMIRRITGIEYEGLMCSKLRELGIPFQSEEELRAAGFSKTPDAKLHVPIGVLGRTVWWIDSKASFGDEYNHRMNASEQFQRYVNRFGPGLVIYWFGYIDDLNDHPDVLLLDHFPSQEEIYCLPTLSVEATPMVD